MTYNYDYAEMMGREILQERRREAERERLIRHVSGWNPPLYLKLWFIIRARWQGRKLHQAQRGSFPAPGVPDNPLRA